MLTVCFRLVTNEMHILFSNIKQQKQEATDDSTQTHSVFHKRNGMVDKTPQLI